MNSGRKVAGVVVALVLALGGTYLVLGGRSDRPPAVTRQQVPMLVANQQLSAGTSVDSLLETPTAVAIRMVDIERRSLDSLVAPDDLQTYKGMVLGADFAPESPLLATSFIDRGTLSVAAGGLEIPGDLLQLSFSLEPQRVLGGALRAGDRVAVVATLKPSDPAQGTQTRIVLQKALVANVQLPNLANVKDSVDDGAPAVVGNYTVTLALSASDTERLTYALENGTLWLAKQPATAKGSGSRIWTNDDVLNSPVTDYAPADGR